ncbi:hypothetical protein AHAS_Ahas12G0269300 [Arachis hypogaea]
MKQQHIVLFFFVLLVSSFLASARLHLDSKQDAKEANVVENGVVQSHTESKDDYIHKLSESEKRMMEEAHLDYIYTQPHSPPHAK